MSGGDTSGAANFEPAVDVISGRASAPPVIILCDHASNALPAGYGTLGLPEAELDRHIGYDIGAAGVARGLAALLGTAAVLSRWSRLLIDLNRGLDDPTLIMRLSDGAVIPGNRHVDIAERERRIDACWRPYHAAVAGLIDAELVQGRTPILVSIHSFTNIWRGAARPWHAAILWDRDPRLALPLIAGLRADASLIVGDNEPYSGKLRGDTLWQHGTSRGLPHAIVEIRQDLIADPPGQDAWAARLACIITAMLADPEHQEALARIEMFGSHTGPL
ncbi:MAG: N-formylglutamate amidohydrolase [Hyphomicrobium aestuarii]|nr:N-formylglutamate amidohydrolase [Hyphomicrobium aestuarii]